MKMEDCTVRRYPGDIHREISISVFLSTIPRSRTDQPLICAGQRGKRRQSEFLFQLPPVSSIISVSSREGILRGTCNSVNRVGPKWQSITLQVDRRQNSGTIGGRQFDVFFSANWIIKLMRIIEKRFKCQVSQKFGIFNWCWALESRSVLDVQDTRNFTNIEGLIHIL